MTGVRHQPLTYLLWRDGRRRLEDDRRRLELGEHLGQGLQDGLGRRDRGRGIGPERHLRRAWARSRSAATSRTATASTSRPTAGQAGRTSVSRTPGRSRGPHPSHESRHRLRRGAGPRVRLRTRSAASSGPRTAARPGRRVLFVDDEDGSIATWRWIPNNPRILYAGFWQVVRHPVGDRERRPGQRALQVDRRRRYLEEADRQRKLRRTSRRASGEGRRGRFGRAAGARFCVSRSEKKGGLYRQRRRRREVDARQRRAQDPRARLVLLLGLPRSEERGHRLPAQRRDAQVLRRGQELSRACTCRTATTTTCGSTPTIPTA